MPTEWNGVERRRGRPPLVPGERTWNINIAFPQSQYDALCAMDRLTGQGLPRIVRLAVARLLKDERGAVIRL